MKQRYFMAKDLGDLECVHDELLELGLKDKQIHVMSDFESELPKHHLLAVNVFSKTDIVRSTLRGAAVGATISAIILLVPLVFNLTTPVGMLPFVLAALVILGLSTWEGGLWGIQETNSRFASIVDKIHRGNHLMIVDYNESQKEWVNETVSAHPMLQPINI